jgi:hypothetical protein
MDKNTKTIILLALLGFGAYRMVSAKTAAPPKTEDPIGPPPEEPEKKEKPKSKEPAYNPLEDRNSLQYKIATIQRKLGTNPDGDSGTINSATHKAFEAKYGLDKGLINASTIAYYLDKVAKNKTTVSKKETIGDAKLIKDTYEKEKDSNLIVRVGGSFNVMELDKSRNVYISTGKALGYTNGSALITPLSVARPRVKIVATTTQGNLLVSVNPTFASAYILSIPASNLMVR